MSRKKQKNPQVTASNLASTLHSANIAKLTAKEAKQVVDYVVRSIADGLECEGRVALHGFGSFEVRVRPASQRINPSTQKKMDVPAKRVVRFHPGSALKERVANSTSNVPSDASPGSPFGDTPPSPASSELQA